MAVRIALVFDSEVSADRVYSALVGEVDNLIQSGKTLMIEQSADNVETLTRQFITTRDMTTEEDAVHEFLFGENGY